MVGIACLCMLVLLARGEKSHAASSKPNVIMFTTDDQTLRDMVAMPRTQALIANRLVVRREHDHVRLAAGGVRGLPAHEQGEQRQAGDAGNDE